MNRIRKTSMRLSSLFVGEDLSFDMAIVSDHIVHYYTDLFITQDSNNFDAAVLDNFIKSVVSQEDNDTLTVLPNADEIKCVVFDMEPSSSTGPDKFGGSFYQTCWDIISYDVIEAVRHFFLTHHIPYGLNSSFVTLILKKPGENRVEDFRPIVMGNYMFKIFMKIVASPLGGIAARILTPFQVGFVPGKRIHTCITLAFDAVNILVTPTRTGNMALKIDIHKAFDMSARLSILINGSRMGYLFCIAKDDLGRWIDWEVVSGRITQISRVPRYLLYADEILIFVKATTGNIRRL
ncbi:hypothetical protein ACS0TY_013630 [Phlomoides rotata]